MVLGDREIRAHAHATVLKNHHKDRQTRVVDELGISHGKARIDIAILNGKLTAFEIKSEKDRLDRLENQVQLYGEVAHKAILITTENHMSAATKLLPCWWGVMIVDRGPRGGIKFHNAKRPNINTAVNALSLCRLLWRNEAQEIMIAAGCSIQETRKPRRQLYEWLSGNIPKQPLTRIVLDTLKARENWRDH